MWLLPLLVLAATPLAAAAAPLDPAAAIEVEAVMEIAGGDAAAARGQLLDRLFGEAVAVAAEGEAEGGVLADRPAAAERLRDHARDYVEAYQIVADAYRLSGEASTAVAQGGGVATPAGAPLPALPPPPATGVAPPPPSSQLTPLANDQYLLRLRAWIDRPRLRAALGLRSENAADLTVELHGADALSGTPERLEPLRARLIAALRDGGWHLADQVAAHHLVVESSSDLFPPGETRQSVAVSLTGRLQGPNGAVEALLQGRGSSTLLDPDPAWGEAEEQAVADLIAHLRPLLPPPAAVAGDRWITVTLAPLPSYGSGLELADLIRNRAVGVAEVQRDTYTDRTLRLRVRTAGDAAALATVIGALHWRDFTLHAEARTAAEVQVEVQRF